MGKKFLSYKHNNLNSNLQDPDRKAVFSGEWTSYPCFCGGKARPGTHRLSSGLHMHVDLHTHERKKTGMGGTSPTRELETEYIVFSCKPSIWETESGEFPGV